MEPLPQPLQSARRGEALVPLLLVGMGAMLRLGGLSAIEFKGDETQAVDLGISLLDARPWATDAPWPATGMRSSQGFSNAPLFNFVMALMWALTHDPARATGLIALANTLALIPFHRWCLLHMDRHRAAVCLGAMSLSPFAVIYSRKLWAQDLLFPGLVALLFALHWLFNEKPWRGAITAILALLFISQLHQSGPFLCAVLPVALLLIAWWRRRAGAPLRLGRPRALQVAGVLGAIGLFAFFWIPYIRYFLALPPSTLGARPRLDFPWPQLVARLAVQVVPTDIFWFFEPELVPFLTEWRAGPLSYLLRTGGLAVASILGVLLGLGGLYQWARRPFRLDGAGVLWWGIVLVFMVMRIPSHPHYVLILYPLPALLVGGAFSLPGPAPRAVRAVRWTYVAALGCLTLGTHLWLSDRGGAEGDYGITYGIRAAQARAVLAGGHGEDAAAEAHVVSDERARTLGCFKPGGEVTWLLKRWQGDDVKVADNLRLCQGWLSDGQKRFAWRVIP